jgi:hypothetical protein
MTDKNDYSHYTAVGIVVLAGLFVVAGISSWLGSIGMMIDKVIYHVWP